MAALQAAVDSPQQQPLQPHQRTQLWLEAMDAAGDAGRILTRSEFELLARYAKATADDETTISKDLPRSRIGGSSADELSVADQGVLQQILRVYAVLDPEVGYCQGMNFVATLCLHVLPGGFGCDLASRLARLRLDSRLAHFRLF